MEVQRAYFWSRTTQFCTHVHSRGKITPSSPLKHLIYVDSPRSPQDYIIGNNCNRCKKSIPWCKPKELSQSTVPHIRIEQQLRLAHDWPMIEVSSKAEEIQKSSLKDERTIIDADVKKVAASGPHAYHVQSTRF